MFEEDGFDQVASVSALSALNLTINPLKQVLIYRCKKTGFVFQI